MEQKLQFLISMSFHGCFIQDHYYYFKHGSADARTGIYAPTTPKKMTDFIVAKSVKNCIKALKETCLK